MELKNLILLSWGVMVLLILNGKPTTCHPGNDWKITRGNYIENEFKMEKNLEKMNREAYDGTDNFEASKQGPVSNEKIEETASSSIEEAMETLKEVKKEADEDLLKGLNMMLNKNETLEDIFKSEKFSGF